ncbi:MAG: lysyl-tRNA synthetase [Parcubacteria group bacterium Gr01-1014_8]|nr:MAG: lysyl-tRNA synthetase [Parcubacteria group bacterium Gr01-1014_8]
MTGMRDEGLSSGESIRAERLKKLQVLKETGMDAYPSHSSRDTSIAEFAAGFEERMKSGKAATVAGRLMSLRGQGGIMFADIFDGTARTQIVLQKAEMDGSLFDLFAETVDVGDFVEATGVAFKTKRGENSLKVSKWRMLAKSLMPIPSEWYGVKDEELKLRQRYLDILLNEDIRAMFERRAKFWKAARDFYLSRGFLEVETPVLETTPGGADARPFITHHNALNMDVYLRISCGELWQKKLLMAGYPKVFEIGRIFRNEGQSREHLQDYTQLESYEAYADAASGMKFVQELYRHVVKETYGQYTFTIGEHTVDFAEVWPTVDFSDAIQNKFGINPIACSDAEAIHTARSAGIQFNIVESPNKARAVDHLWKLVRKSISGPAFLVGVPVFLEPLAKRKSDNMDVVDRIQVLIAGSEIGKGYSELNDPLDQYSRFEEQQKMRDAGDPEAQRLDKEYVQAMEYGMPPAFGFGVSERLFAFLENRPAHETQLFPLLRPKVD